jgi:iron uptake system component EfeO
VIDKRSAVVALVLSCLTAACGSSLIVKKQPVGAIRTVHVALMAAGCTPAALAAKAGPTNFVIANTKSQSVTEFEIHEGTNILAEAEFVTPGLAKSFAITLEPGHYTTLCTGGTLDGGKGTLTVTGRIARSSGGPSAQASAAAVAKYRAYLETQGALLVRETTAFVDAVQSGDIVNAKRLYSTARAPYERIEPVARTFSELDPSINDRSSDVTTGHWNGFHRIEHALYDENDLTGMGPTATQLLSDVTTLQRDLRTVHLEPATIANGAIQLLNEVATIKLTGQEDVDAHTDLADAVANVEGAQAAFDAVATLLPHHDAISAQQTDQRLQAIVAAFRPLQRGTGSVTPAQLSSAQVRQLVQITDAAAGALSQVPKAILG